MATRTARQSADARRREREPYRKLFDHVRQACRLRTPQFSPRMVAILGYDYAQFKTAILRSLKPGMTWQAFMRGDLHIGHKTPLGAFDRSTLAGIRAAWALDNIEATWPADNVSKLRADRAIIKASRMAA